MKYTVNSGKRNHAIRLGCETGLYDFITDYAKHLGMSRSGALRRLALIGARCEKEHGTMIMPASYGGLPGVATGADDDPLGPDEEGDVF